MPAEPPPTPDSPLAAATPPRAAVRRRTAPCPIAVTGLGAWTGAGTTMEAGWQAVVAGRSAARAVAFGARAFPAVPAPMPELSGAAVRSMRSIDRAAAFAVAAALEAAANSGVLQRWPARRIALIVGTSRGPQHAWLEAAARQASGRRMRPSLALASTIGGLAGPVAAALGITGPVSCESATCASGAFAIASAARLLVLGEADAVIAGATDAPLNPLVVDQLAATGVLADGSGDDPQPACRPFDRRRSGLVLGEGAAFLVLEREADARTHGVPPLARLAAWSTSLSRAGRAGVAADGAAIADLLADLLLRAHWNPSDVDHVNAHGTGTRLNDLAEAAALRTVFGDPTPPIAATKPVTGHCLGATAALEAAFAILTLRDQLVPPSAGPGFEPDPACALDLVSGTARPLPLRRSLSTSLGFWGFQAALAFERPD